MDSEVDVIIVGAGLAGLGAATQLRRAGKSVLVLEASDRGYWAPSAETLDALRDAAADLEDRLEGIPA